MLVCEIHAFPIPCYLCSFLTEEELSNAPKGTPQRQTLNKTQAYRDHWRELHTKTDATPEWFEDWLSRIPSLGCSCQSDFAKYVKDNPPDFDAFYQWSVNAHNFVNKKLGKPIWQAIP